MSATGIRAMRPEDWPTVEAVYREGLATGNASFEADPPPWDTFDAGKLKAGRLVAVDTDGDVIGWIAASTARSRWWRRSSAPGLISRGDGRRRSVDGAVEHLFGEPREPRTPRAGGFPPRGAEGAHRAHDVRSVGGEMARHRSDRATPCRRVKPPSNCARKTSALPLR